MSSALKENKKLLHIHFNGTILHSQAAFEKRLIGKDEQPEAAPPSSTPLLHLLPPSPPCPLSLLIHPSPLPLLSSPLLFSALLLDGALGAHAGRHRGLPFSV